MQNRINNGLLGNSCIDTRVSSEGNMSVKICPLISNCSCGDHECCPINKKHGKKY